MTRRRGEEEGRRVRGRGERARELDRPRRPGEVDRHRRFLVEHPARAAEVGRGREADGPERGGDIPHRRDLGSSALLPKAAKPESIGGGKIDAISEVAKRTNGHSAGRHSGRRLGKAGHQLPAEERLRPMAPGGSRAAVGLQRNRPFGASGQPPVLAHRMRAQITEPLPQPGQVPEGPEAEHVTHLVLDHFPQGSRRNHRGEIRRVELHGPGERQSRSIPELRRAGLPENVPAPVDRNDGRLDPQIVDSAEHRADIRQVAGDRRFPAGSRRIEEPAEGPVPGEGDADVERAVGRRRSRADAVDRKRVAPGVLCRRRRRRRSRCRSFRP